MADEVVTRRVVTDYVSNTRQQERETRGMIAELRQLRRETQGLRRDQQARHRINTRHNQTLRTTIREEGRLNRTLRERRRILRTMPGMGLARTGGRILRGAAFGLGAGAVVGAGLGIGSLLGAYPEREREQLNLATMFGTISRGEGSPIEFATAMGMASDSIRRFREEARSTPGTTQDIMTAFSDVVELSRRGGASFDDIIKFSAVLASRDVLSGGVKGTVSRDVRQLLGGQYSAQSIQTPQLKGAAGKQAAQLARQGRGDQALNLLRSTLALSQQERKAAEMSFGGSFATLKDEIREVAIAAGDPIFKWLGTQFREWAAYLRENQGAVAAWAREFGRDVVGVLEDVGHAGAMFVDVLSGLSYWLRSLASIGDEYVRRYENARETLSETTGLDFMGLAYRRARADAQVLRPSAGPGFFGQIDPLQAPAKVKPASLTQNNNIRVGRIEQKIEVETDDPARIASAALVRATQAVVRRPLRGVLDLANGG